MLLHLTENNDELKKKKKKEREKYTHFMYAHNFCNFSVQYGKQKKHF